MRTVLRLATLTIAGLAVIAPDSTCSAEPTYAERLGYPPGAKVIMFHNDDAGMSHASNLGTIEGIEKGVITSFSIMMPCPWVPEIVTWLKSHPDACSGLHLTMNSEWDAYRWNPVAGAAAVPTLADAQGYLPDSVREVAQGASADDVEREIRAQIAKAEAMGIRISHIDTHMGALVSRPDIAERYFKVGIEKQLPVLAIGGHMQYAGQEEDPEVIARIAEMAKKVWDAGLPVLDDLHTASYGWKEGDKTERFVQDIRNMKPGVLKIIIHATRPTEEFPVITPSSDLRLRDLTAVINPDLRKAIEEEGVILTSWRELMERRQRVGK